jgi:hypothetical protein
MYDPKTGATEWKEEELDESDVEDVICYLEEIFIPKIWEPDIQQQDELIWRQMMKFSDFKNAFKGYSNARYVMPGSQFSDSSIFSDFISYDVRGSDFVEVFKYYNVPKDQYAIIANGVLLNGVEDAEKKCEVPSPLPWNHKKLPFSKSIFEPIEPTFFYGMPLAIKVKSPQEALNRMWELLLERETRSVAAPIITTDPSVELGLEFKSGHIYQVQAPVDQYKELQISGASGSFWQAITALDGIVMKTGSGGLNQAFMSRQPKTATENAQVAQQQRETTGLYTLFYQDLLEQKVWLTLQNMIQFYTAAKTESVIGDRKFHKILALTEQKLYGGGIGNREIRISDNPASAEELTKESYFRSIFRKEHVEIIEVSPQSLQKLKFDIKINFEVENSPEQERALFLDYVTTITKLFGQTGLISMKKLLYRTIEKFNENVADMVDEKVAMDYEQERFGLQPNVVPPQPEQDNQDNMGGTPAVQDIKQQQIGQRFGAGGAGARMVNKGQSPTNVLKKF